MASNLPPVPYQAPLIDQNGMLTQIWADWFKKALVRMGGSIADTNEELYMVTAERMDDGSVTARAMAADSVPTYALQSQAVTSDKLQDFAVTADKIQDSSIVTSKLNNQAVDVNKLADSAVSFVKLLSSEWANSKTVNGYMKLGALTIQWGATSSLSSGSTTSVSFPTAFSAACLQVLVSVRDNSATVTSVTGQPGTGGYSVSGFSLYNRTSAAQNFNWMAVGY
jgi:hypothetical protein